MHRAAKARCPESCISFLAYTPIPSTWYTRGPLPATAHPLGQLSVSCRAESSLSHPMTPQYVPPPQNAQMQPTPRYAVKSKDGYVQVGRWPSAVFVGPRERIAGVDVESGCRNGGQLGGGGCCAGLLALRCACTRCPSVSPRTTRMSNPSPVPHSPLLAQPASLPSPLSHQHILSPHHRSRYSRGFHPSRNSSSRCNRACTSRTSSSMRSLARRTLLCR